MLQDAGYNLTNALGGHILSPMDHKSRTLSNALGEDSNAFGGAFHKGITTRKCGNPNCEVVFRPTRFWQKFHSVKCRNDFYWSKHTRITVPTTTNQ